MNKKAYFGALAGIALILLICSFTLELSDFLSGIIAGACIVAEVVSLVVILKTVKEEKK